ncbi:MAG: hypothetical protein M1361_01960 [Patescibacteria group bacterium]|nr:hypothetical protein [Patescibacteria group bacterium]MCL5224351.1 hypothetical protein [Patescibacteria group bacterium]
MEQSVNSKDNFNAGHSGQSLMEVLIAVTIATVVIGAAVGALLSATSDNAQNRATQLATSYEQELMGNLRSLAESNWSQVYNLNKGSNGTYYLATYQQLPGTVNLTSGSNALNGSGTNFTSSLAAGDNIKVGSLALNVNSITSDTLLTLTTTSTVTTSSQPLYRNYSIRTGKETITANKVSFTRWFSIQNVFRDTCGTGSITTATATACTVTSTGALIGVLPDPSTQQVTIYVTWNNGLNSYTVNQDISRVRDQITNFNDWSGGQTSNSSTVFAQPTNHYASSTGVSATTVGQLHL